MPFYSIDILLLIIIMYDDFNLDKFKLFNKFEDKLYNKTCRILVHGQYIVFTIAYCRKYNLHRM